MMRQGRSRGDGREDRRDSGAGRGRGRGRGRRGDRYSAGTVHHPSTLTPPKSRRDCIGSPSLPEINTEDTLTKVIVNHFEVKYEEDSSIWHYNVDIKSNIKKPDVSLSPTKKSDAKISKIEMRMIVNKLLSYNRFPLSATNTAYDGVKNIFSTEPPSTYNQGIFEVKLKGTRSYRVSIQSGNELKLSRLADYFNENGDGNNLQANLREVLHGMDVVINEVPSRNSHRTLTAAAGDQIRYGYPEKILEGGIKASAVMRQSLKPTEQGLALCLNYSILPLIHGSSMTVSQFLEYHIPKFGESNYTSCKDEVNKVLKGLKVQVAHRKTNQTFTIAGLDKRSTETITFTVNDGQGEKETYLVDYYMQKHGKEIEKTRGYTCLEMVKGGSVPMEFCTLVDGQRCAKQNLKRGGGPKFLKDIQPDKPTYRKNMILQMVQADNGPRGENVAQNFGIRISVNMTEVEARILRAPELRLVRDADTPSGSGRTGRVGMKKVNNKCQWKLSELPLVDAKTVDQWVLLDFTTSPKDRPALQQDDFIRSLRMSCERLGMRMEGPRDCCKSEMSILDNIHKLREILRGILQKAKNDGENLQIIICAMTNKHHGYKYLKWISETEIGILTQCCLSTNANGPNPNKRNSYYFDNLALKINAKLQGSNTEVHGRLPCFERIGKDDHVMFVGADVNHPPPGDSKCPSIAAVVATLNWPAANRYAARLSPQDHRTEMIQKFGSMCLDLVRHYRDLNGVKPQKIVVFRDGVSESQFDTVRREELEDLKKAFSEGEDKYIPTITIVLAQKRHHTRLFPLQDLETERTDRDTESGNVLPGTVVDTKIIDGCGLINFFLCSHYGSLGTSRPTHYYVLHDEHNFTADRLQKLIFYLCFTFARCTKAVSLVPPVYYADLVAYRGRLFQEAVVEANKERPQPEKESAAFDHQFYKLHKKLEKIMFFV